MTSSNQIRTRGLFAFTVAFCCSALVMGSGIAVFALQGAIA